MGILATCSVLRNKGIRIQNTQRRVSGGVSVEFQDKEGGTQIVTGTNFEDAYDKVLYGGGVNENSFDRR